jgi:hypothetical protein
MLSFHHYRHKELVYTRAHIHTHTHTYKCTRARTYIHTCTHTHTHTHARTLVMLRQRYGWLGLPWDVLSKIICDVYDPIGEYGGIFDSLSIGHFLSPSHALADRRSAMTRFRASPMDVVWGTWAVGAGVREKLLHCFWSICYSALGPFV